MDIAMRIEMGDEYIHLIGENKLRSMKADVSKRLDDEEIENIIKPKLRRLVGVCYAERRKGGGSNAFIRILDWEETKIKAFVFIYEELRLEKDGQVCIRLGRIYDFDKGNFPFQGYKEISSNDYLDVRNKIVYELETQGKMRKILTGSKKRKNK